MRALNIFYFFIYVSCNFSVYGQTFSIVNRTTHNQNHFGWDISGYKNYCCISDPRDSISNYGNGSINVYVRDKEEWKFSQNISKPLEDQTPYELFGYKTAMFGEYLAVSSVGNEKMGFMAGSVSLYRINGTWSFLQELFPAFTAERTYFGESIQLNNDYLFIGAPGIGDNGLVYVYKFNGELFSLTQIIESPYPVHFDFGKTLYATGDNLFIGAPSVNKTSIRSGVFVYSLIGGEWQKTQEIPCPEAEIGSMFGYSLASSGNTLIIGAPHSTVFHDDNEEYFFAGKVFIYSFFNNSWNPEQSLSCPDPDSHDIFGQEIFYKDSIIFVSSLRSDNIGVDNGIVYAYKFFNGSWEPNIKLNSGKNLEYFGNNIFVLNNQLLIAFGGNKSDKSYGEVYCYQVDGLIDNTVPVNISESLTSPYTIKVFPNPASEMVTIESNSNSKNQLSLYNSSGELILSKTFRRKYTVDVSEMTEGIYLISVVSEFVSFTEKVILKK
jgi:hypothetical protein